MLIPLLFGLGIALGLVVALIAAVHAGRWLGKRRGLIEQADDPHIGIVQGAILGLLGLLLGFSFSGASARFADRQEVLVKEAAAISTAYQRCDLLPAHVGDLFRAALREYTEARLELFHAAGQGDDDSNAVVSRMRAAQETVWARAVDAVAAAPQFTNIMTPVANEIGDLLAARNAASRKHTPALVLAVMITCAMVALASVGYVLGLGKPPRLVTAPVIMLVLLIAATLWTIIDLDMPRYGLIQISGQPLIELRESLRQGSAHPPIVAPKAP